MMIDARIATGGRDGGGARGWNGWLACLLAFSFLDNMAYVNGLLPMCCVFFQQLRFHKCELPGATGRKFR